MSGPENQLKCHGKGAVRLRSLTSEEGEIIELLHFIQTFADLSEETGYSGPVLEQCLARLIKDGFVLLMKWNDERRDFLPVNQHDAAFESCNFMATKQGLQAYYYFS